MASQFEKLRSWLSTFYDLHQFWSLGSLTTVSLDAFPHGGVVTGRLQNVPRPFGVELGRPHTDLKTLRRAEQPGLGFHLRALAAVSCSGFCRSRKDSLWPLGPVKWEWEAEPARDRG